MNKQVKLIISIIVCIVLFVGAILLYNNLKDKPMDEGTTKPVSQSTNADSSSQDTSKEPTTKQKYYLPEITFYDSNKNKVNLSDFRGKKVIINLWATWCGYCVEEMPDFQNAYNNHKDEIEFIMLNVENRGESSVKLADEFIAEKGFTFPVYYDIDMQSNKYMNLTRGGIPATFFIDEDGSLVAMQPGMMNETMLNKGIQMLLEG